MNVIIPSIASGPPNSSPANVENAAKFVPNPNSRTIPRHGPDDETDGEALRPEASELSYTVAPIPRFLPGGVDEKRGESHAHHRKMMWTSVVRANWSRLAMTGSTMGERERESVEAARSRRIGGPGRA
jgi:hypothetical protein